MGTVHAKQADTGMTRGLAMDDPVDLDEDSLPKPTINLNGVRARVDRVHVDGLNRTKDDVIRSTVDELFQATDFEDVILRAHRVRRALDSMGCFRDIGVYIDVSSGPGATPEGLEVTFQVKELSRIVGGINTTVSENEGNVVIGVKLPNLLGRGEKASAEYSLGHRSSTNFSLAATKPYPHKPFPSAITATIYQQNHEYPMSGYRLLDRGVLFDLAFNTSPTTKHNLQWEGIVRETSVLSKTTSFRVRESSGPSMKSVVRHLVSVDRRDSVVFPSRGGRVRWVSEVAGLGGGVAHLKAECSVEHNTTLAQGVVLQVTGSLGVLHDVFGTTLADHYYLGGAGSLRGFQLRGVGPHHDNQPTGGTMYWLGGLHIFAPLPFQPARGAIGDLFRSHLFVNAGYLGMPEDLHLSLRAARVSLGLGLALRLGAARLELNYCAAARALPGDRPAPGLQLGLHAHLL